MGILISLCAIVAGAGIVLSIPDTGYTHSFLTIAAGAGAIGIALSLTRAPRVCAVLAFIAVAASVFMPLFFLVLWPVVLFCGAVVVWHMAHRFTAQDPQPTNSRYWRAAVTPRAVGASSAPAPDSR